MCISFVYPLHLLHLTSSWLLQMEFPRTQMLRWRLVCRKFIGVWLRGKHHLLGQRGEFSAKKLSCDTVSIKTAAKPPEGFWSWDDPSESRVRKRGLSLYSVVHSWGLLLEGTVTLSKGLPSVEAIPEESGGGRLFTAASSAASKSFSLKGGSSCQLRQLKKEVRKEKRKVEKRKEGEGACHVYLSGPIWNGMWEGGHSFIRVPSCKEVRGPLGRAVK